MDKSLTVVIPTISRPTLARALASLERQAWLPGDEVLVVGDGHQEQAESLVLQFPPLFRYLTCPGGPRGCWGHNVRNWVNSRYIARGAWMVALDDDDEMVPGAVEGIRSSLVSPVPHFFRIDCTALKLGVLWKTPEIKLANISTGCIVAPRASRVLSVYDETRYSGDLSYALGLEAYYKRHDQEIIWVPEVITVSRPHAATLPK